MGVMEDNVTIPIGRVGDPLSITLPQSPCATRAGVWVPVEVELDPWGEPMAPKDAARARWTRAEMQKAIELLERAIVTWDAHVRESAR